MLASSQTQGALVSARAVVAQVGTAVVAYWNDLRLIDRVYLCLCAGTAMTLVAASLALAPGSCTGTPLSADGALLAPVAR